MVFDTPLGVGGSFIGISMQVDYLGGGDPLMQYYEVVDPVTFLTIADGYTVPEPVTLLLLGLGGLAARRKR
ncbi:MAG: PEP-CTERM sorting domain-containing protein [Phycisphaerae bacterium]|nr:PEP-CTERM sorting domain-containing protein [Phycisphaerae bacterium]